MIRKWDQTKRTQSIAALRYNVTLLNKLMTKIHVLEITAAGQVLILTSLTLVVIKPEKYYLQLLFRPRHRQAVSNDMDAPILQKWEQQVSEKCEFIPLSKLLLPEYISSNTRVRNVLD